MRIGVVGDGLAKPLQEEVLDAADNWSGPIGGRQSVMPWDARVLLPSGLAAPGGADRWILAPAIAAHLRHLTHVRDSVVPVGA